MSTNNLEIVTSCDEDYSYFLRHFAQNVRKIFNRRPQVYDLGLSKNTQRLVDAQYIRLDITKEFKTINNENCIRAVHKPLCLIHYIQNNDNPFIFIDTDCLFINKIIPGSHDLYFTFRLYSEQTKNDFAKNGYVNSGVIIFNNSSDKKENFIAFLSDWRDKCYSSDSITDQKALSDMLFELDSHLFPGKEMSSHGLSIKILPSEEFNDVKCQTGRIWHFKRANRRPDKKEKYANTAYALQNKYKLFLSIVYIQRFIFLIKKKFRPQRYRYRYLEAQTK